MITAEVAKELIEAVGGIVTDVNIAGVMLVLDGVKQGVNNTWEEHLARETNDLLMLDVINCDGCGGKLKITRTTGHISVRSV